jgi:hypothetical protein
VRIRARVWRVSFWCAGTGVACQAGVAADSASWARPGCEAAGLLRVRGRRRGEGTLRWRAAAGRRACCRCVQRWGRVRGHGERQRLVSPSGSSPGSLVSGTRLRGGVRCSSWVGGCQRRAVRERGTEVAGGSILLPLSCSGATARGDRTTAGWGCPGERERGKVARFGSLWPGWEQDGT